MFWVGVVFYGIDLDVIILIVDGDIFGLGVIINVVVGVVECDFDVIFGKFLKVV